MDRAETASMPLRCLPTAIDSSYVLPLSVRADDQGKVRPEKNSVIIRVVMK